MALDLMAGLGGGGGGGGAAAASLGLAGASEADSRLLSADILRAPASPVLDGGGPMGFVDLGLSSIHDFSRRFKIVIKLCAITRKSSRPFFSPVRISSTRPRIISPAVRFVG